MLVAIAFGALWTLALASWLAVVVYGFKAVLFVITVPLGTTTVTPEAALGRKK